MKPGILITQCVQRDFVQPIGKYDPLPNALHVGYAEAQRLLGENLEEGPVALVMDWAYAQPREALELVHIRDWHRGDSAGEQAHFQQFGAHCLAGSPGAEFVFPIPSADRHRVVNASGLNDFLDTDLERILEPWKAEPVRVGLMGVWTEAKVLFLAFELASRYPRWEIGVCSALCASSSRQMHFIALDQMKSLLGVRVFASVGDFTTFLTGELPSLPALKTARLDPGRLHFVNPYNMQAPDQQMVLYLFRDCQEVELKGLDGGFSGNVVLKARSRDAWGHQQVPCVVKIGRRDLIAQERISFEKIQEVLGNNAPGITDFVELGDRGAIKYRYAAMLEGEVTCFQDLWEGGASLEAAEGVLDRVFSQQLGRLYEAESFEKLNLVEYYDFQPKWAPGVERRVRGILGVDPGDSLDQEIAPGVKARDLVKFYAVDSPVLARQSQRLHYVSYVHGDLNGKNILVDAQGNVWIIDFFGCHRGHVLRDLVKLENDLLYIFTKIETEEELVQGQALVDKLLAQEDLAAAPRPEEAQQFSSPMIQRAWEGVCLLRSYYPQLVRLDRSAHQVHLAMLRYAAHTLGFDECTPLQKRWALYTCGRCVAEILRTHSGSRELKIDFLPLEGPGALGLTILPGRKDRGRDLGADLDRIKKSGIRAVVCLLTENEFERYGVGGLREAYRGAGLEVLHLPIMDQGIPTREQMETGLAWMYQRIAGGQGVLVHCVGGLGRSGLVAGVYLKRFQGRTGQEAIDTVRRVRSRRAIETAIQEEFLREF